MRTSEPAAEEDGLAAPIKKVDTRQLCLTTELISSLLMRLLKENDNSENAFDDCFYIGKILSSLGKLDNFKHMPAIAQEIKSQFYLD